MKYIILIVGLLSGLSLNAQDSAISIVANGQNDLVEVFKLNNIEYKLFESLSQALADVPDGTGIIVTASGYPEQKVRLAAQDLSTASTRNIRLYIEYSDSLPGIPTLDQVIHTKLERGIVVDESFKDIAPGRILGINDGYIIPMRSEKSLLVAGKVAGFDSAAYGIDDVFTIPLLFHHKDWLVATSKLSNFSTGRYGPNNTWKAVWQYIISWVAQKEVQLENWPTSVRPMYTAQEVLPDNAKLNSIEKGVEWFDNGKFFIDSEWEDFFLAQQGDGTNPMGPPVADSLSNGDGRLGLLEGHASNIYHDGSQQYRYWLRADVQGEAAFALGAASKLFNSKQHLEKAANIIDYTFDVSNLRAGPRDDPKNPAYGLVGWSVTHPGIYYGDDNARFILGLLGGSAFTNTNKWDKDILKAILSNFRTTGAEGFRGERIEQHDLEANGWEHYWERNIVHPAPHFESWMWACYLWLYQHTGYKPLLEKSKKGIANMMKMYPDEWQWTNGIQQERARMILPLAWLVRVENTAKHRKWLDQMVSELLVNQDTSGGIREELGRGEKGRFGKTLNNASYGLHEAPLIFENGDPIADMLYTNNFAFFSLNEAAHATKNPKYYEAVGKLSDFLTRIQVTSSKHNDLEGAWFRGFDFDRWEYWASNADAGWGAWGTLSGWTQSWIVATQALTVLDTNFWDLTKESEISKSMPEVVKGMGLPKK